jgi:hypothetical protein
VFLFAERPPVLQNIRIAANTYLFHKQDVTDLSASQLVSLKSTSDEQMVVVMNK